VKTLSVPASGSITVSITGPGNGSLVFTQVSAAATWDIVHNLGMYPSVTVVDTGNSVLIPDVQYISPNECKVLLSVPTSGKAYLS
jgi:hypothetical protein